MNKYIIIFCLTLIYNNIQANNNFEINIIKVKAYSDSANSIIILLSTTDCFKCIMPLNNFIKNSLKSEIKYQYVVVTDNISYARKFNSDYKLNARLIYDREIFSQNNKSAIVAKYNNQFTYLDSKSITSYAQQSTQDTILRFVDSLLAGNNFSSAGTKYGFVIFDELLQEAIDIRDKENISYRRFQILNNNIVMNLPDRVNYTAFRKLSDKESQNCLDINNIPIIHINSISSLDNNIFTVFSVNRCYVNTSKSDDYGIFTTYFIAKKKVENIEHHESIFNLNTYNAIYYIDSFTYNEDTYPLGPWISNHPTILNDSTIKINVNKVDREKNRIEFGGAATIILKQNGMTEMINIDTQAQATNIIHNAISIFEKEYFIFKTISDASLNMGEILILRN